MRRARYLIHLLVVFTEAQPLDAELARYAPVCDVRAGYEAAHIRAPYQRQWRRGESGLTATMQLARVIGTVVATGKNDSLEGRKLLVIQSLDQNLGPQGKPMVAIDAAGAGVGELVFWCRGREASFPFKREDTPTDCTIVAIVDSDGHVCC